MGMWTIGCWLVYSIIVGSVARWIHPGDDPEGFLPTIGIGVSGSFIGGAINFLLGWGGPLESSGLAMGVIGGIIACTIYRMYVKNSG